jgi:hypothetical protein
MTEPAPHPQSGTRCVLGSACGVEGNVAQHIRRADEVDRPSSRLSMKGLGGSRVVPGGRREAPALAMEMGVLRSSLYQWDNLADCALRLWYAAYCNIQLRESRMTVCERVAGLLFLTVVGPGHAERSPT